MATTTEPLEIAQLRQSIITKELAIQLLEERIAYLEERDCNPPSTIP